MPLYWSCNQKFKVPSRLQPTPGSRADVASDLPATKSHHPNSLLTWAGAGRGAAQTTHRAQSAHGNGSPNAGIPQTRALLFYYAVFIDGAFRLLYVSEHCVLSSSVNVGVDELKNAVADLDDDDGMATAAPTKG